MPGLLGINTSGDGTADPAELADAGARWVRCVVNDDQDITGWISELLHMHGIETLLVGDGNPHSLGTDEAEWPARMEAFKARYGHLVKTWQLGNEPDSDDPNSIASWKMPKDQYNRLLAVAREVFPRPEFTLVGAGLSSGQPGWLDDIDLDAIDILDVHPYAKEPNTPELIGMLDGYAARKQPLWCTEYDCRTPGMGADLVTRVERAAAMCWSSQQVVNEPGMGSLGLRENIIAMNDFRLAAGLPLVA